MISGVQTRLNLAPNIIFYFNIKSVLLNGPETRKTAKITTNELDTFINCYLGTIELLKWYDIITNAKLKGRTKHIPVSEEMMDRHQRWLGQTEKNMFIT